MELKWPRGEKSYRLLILEWPYQHSIKRFVVSLIRGTGAYTAPYIPSGRWQKGRACLARPIRQARRRQTATYACANKPLVRATAAVLEFFGMISTSAIRGASDKRYRDALYRHWLAYLDDPDGVDKNQGYRIYGTWLQTQRFLIEMETKK